jgi:hypothetical protein
MVGPSLSVVMLIVKSWDFKLETAASAADPMLSLASTRRSSVAGSLCVRSHIYYRRGIYE